MGLLPKNECVSILKNSLNGGFVVRESLSSGSLVLSVKYKHWFLSVKIIVAGHRYYLDGEDEGYQFLSVLELIDYYNHNEVQVRGTDSRLITFKLTVGMLKSK